MFNTDNSNNLWEQFFAENPNPMWVYDLANFKFLDVNKRATQVYGYSKQEFLQLTVQDLLDPEELQNQISGSIYENEIEKVETFYKHQTKKNDAIWVKLSQINLVYDSSNAKLVTAIDFTQTKAQKNQLREKNKELESLSLVAKYTNNLVLITDETGKVTWVNNAFSNTMLYNLDEIVGKQPSEFLHGPLSDSAVRLRIKAAIKNKLPFREEIIHYTKNNEPVWILKDGQPVFDQQNRLIKYVIVETNITAQKQQQEKLNRSESELNAFFNSSGSILVLFDTAFKVLAFNNKAASIIKELMHSSIKKGDFIFDILSDSFKSSFRHFANKALEGKRTENMEVQLPGNDMWWNVRYLPLLDSFGNIIGASFTAIDITDKKNAEAILIENEKRYHLVTKATFDAIWDYDLEKNTMYRGEGFVTLFGHNSGKLIDGLNNWESLIHQDDYNKVIGNFQHAVNSNLTNWSDEYRFLKSDGTYTHVRDRAIIIRNAEGKAIRIVGAMQDISQQIKREEQLKLFESAIKNTTDAVVITGVQEKIGSDVKIVFVNEAFTKMTGYSFAEIIGKSPRILQGELSDRIELKRLKDAIINWKPCEIETVNYKKNGDPFWVNISVVPVANDDGWYTHWIAIQKDMTERRNQMAERELMIHELTKNNFELKQFSYITSHNLRAPLTNMMGIFNLIDWSLIQDRRMFQLLNGLKQSTFHLNDTLHDLIKILIIKENIQIELSNIYFNTVYDTVVYSLQNFISNANARIESDFSQAPKVRFSKVYLESILLNLLTNAIKFKSPNTSPFIKIWSTENNGTLKLHIADNGIGMDWQKVKDKVFGLYQKFHNVDENKGVGLYLVHAQVTALGGKIDLVTQPNKGSTFTITFK